MHVAAVNNFEILSIAGGAGGGIAGIGGGVDVGVVRNNTSALIQAGAVVSASQNVEVYALAAKDIDSVGLSAAGGAVALVGSVSVWSIGSEFNGTYEANSGDDSTPNQTDEAVPAGQTDFVDAQLSGDDPDNGMGESNNGWRSILNGYSTEDRNGSANSNPDSTSEIGKGTSQGSDGINQNGPTGNEISTATSSPVPETTPDGIPTGTVAFIGSGAVIEAGDDIFVEAQEDIDFDVLVGSASVGVAGIGGSVGVSNVKSNVEAFVGSQALLTAGSESTDDIRVAAGLNENLNGTAFAGQAGVAGLGAQVIVFNDRSSQTAHIDLGAQITRAGGTVEVLAESVRDIDANVVGGNIGGVAAGASIAHVTVAASDGNEGTEGQTVASIGDQVQVGNGIENDGAVGNLTVLADSDTTINADAIAISAGAVAGTGADAQANISTRTEASIGDDAIVSTSGQTRVNAIGMNTANAISRGGAGGAVSVGAMLAHADVSGSTKAFIEEGATVLAGSLDVTALGENTSHATVVVVGIGVLSGAGAHATSTNTAIAEAYIGPKIDTAAFVRETFILVTGDTRVVATAINSANADSGGVAGGAVTVSAMLADAILGGATTAFITEGVRLVSGNLTVSAQATLNVEAKTKAVAGGVASGAGNTATSDLTSRVDAFISANTRVFVDDLITVSATATPDADAEARGVSGGLGAVAVSLARLTMTPTINAWIGGLESLLVSGRLFVSAQQNLPNTQTGELADSGRALATGSAGGLIGGTGSDTSVVNESQVGSSIKSDARVEVEGEVIVTAQNLTRQSADSSNAAGGVVAAGGTVASVISDTVTRATVGDRVNLVGGTLSVTARAEDDNFAKTTAGFGGAIAGAGARPLTSTTSDVRAEIGPNSIINLLTDVDRDGIINSADADSDNDGIPDAVDVDTFLGQANSLDQDNDGIVDFADADTNNNGIPDAAEVAFVGGIDITGGLNGGPDGIVDAAQEIVPGGDVDFDGILDNTFIPDPNDPNIGAVIVFDPDLDNDGIIDVFNPDFDRDGILDLADALVNLVSGVIVGGSDLDGDGVIDEFDPDSPDNRDANLGGFVLSADHTATVNSQIVTNGGGVLSGAGGEADNDVDSTVQTSVGASVIVEARDIAIDAVNRTQKPELFEDGPIGEVAIDHIKGITGGAATAAGADSETRLTLATQVLIGNQAFLDVQGSPLSPGDLELRAKNEISANDKVTFITGGALAGAGGSSSFETLEDLAKVTIGDGAILQSVGEVTISARGEGDVTLQVNVETYGAATVAAANSFVLLLPHNEVVIGLNAVMTANGDLNISSGTNTDFERDEYRILARTDTFAGSAIPIDIVDAEAFLVQDNRITIHSGALLQTARDAKIHAEEFGLADLTAQAKAVNWASEIGDAINSLGGSGVEQFEGRSHFEAHGIVTNDGTVRTGIKRHQVLTLDSWDSIAGLAFASEQSDGVRFTNSRQLLQSDLVDQLDKAKIQLERYRGTNQTLEDFYTGEILRLEQELLELGLAENPLDENGNPSGELNPIEQLAMTVTVDPIVAYPGIIDVRADQLVGSGEFDAPGDASVIIENKTPAFLNLLGITIPDQVGGVFYNGVLVVSNAQIQAHNDFNAEDDNRDNVEDVFDPDGNPIDEDVTAGIAAFSSISNNANTELPLITVRNTFVPGSRPDLEGTDVYPPPAIRVLGPVDNLRGSFTIENLRGDIEIQARVRAQNISVVAGGSVFVEGLTSFTVGGEPFAILRELTGKAGTTAYTSAQITSMVNQVLNTPSVLGDRIFISAEYLNINGILQSGKEDFVLSLGSSTTQEINAILSSGQSGRVLLNSATNFDFTVFFDTVTRQIQVDEVRVSGGIVELEGHILNTASGEIRLLGGFGNIDITNSTGFDMVVNRVDASQRGGGTLLINDKAKVTGNSPFVTIYQKTDQGVTITQDDGTGPVVSTGNDQSIYDPKAGWRYGWTIAQETALRKFKRFATSSWLGIDALVPNPATVRWDRITNLSQPQLTPEGPYYFLNEGLSNTDYTHSAQSITQASRTYTAKSWTKSTWYGKKTYYRDVVNETRNLNLDTHTIKADRPIDVKFIGLEEGRVSINSTNVGADVLLDGAILNPTGTTLISSQGSIEQLNDSATIGGRIITLNAREGIGVNEALQTDLSQLAVQFTNAFGEVLLNTPSFNLTAVSDESHIVDLSFGNRVRLAEGFAANQGISGRVYQFVGQTDVTVDLNLENYLNPLRWTEVVQDTRDQVRLTEDFVGDGNPGAVYRFVGEPALVDLTKENYLDATRWERVDLFTNLSAVTTGGLIQIEEISGDLRINQIRSGDSSDVTLTAQGGIFVGQVAANTFFEGLVAGGAISLLAESGGVGSDGQAIVLDSGDLLKDKVNVAAAGSVFLTEKFGDLRLEKITANGDVRIEVVSGNLLDVNQESELDERTFEELKAGVWTDLQLTADTGAFTKIDDTIASAQAIKVQEYRTYWQFRNTQNDPTVFDPNHEITLSAGERDVF